MKPLLSECSIGAKSPTWIVDIRVTNYKTNVAEVASFRFTADINNGRLTIDCPRQSAVTDKFVFGRGHIIQLGVFSYFG